MEPDGRNVYPENLAVFAYRHGVLADGGGENADGDRYLDGDRFDRSSGSPGSALDDGDSGQSTFGVDLSGKTTGLAGKSFTIAAILGLTTAEEDAMNLSVQQRLHRNQIHLQNYLHAGGRGAHGLADGYGRNVPVARQAPPHCWAKTSYKWLPKTDARTRTKPTARRAPGGTRRAIGSDLSRELIGHFTCDHERTGAYF